MDLRDFIKIILRYRYMITVMCLSAVVTATGLTYVLSEKYRSSATVMIRPQTSLDVVPERQEMLSFPVSYFTPVETTSKTYSEIIKSRTVAERVVQRLGLRAFQGKEEEGWRYYWGKMKQEVKDLLTKAWTLLKYGRIEEEDALANAVTQVQGGLTVKPTKETYLFELQAESNSPPLSSAIANMAAEELVSYLQELRSFETGEAQKSSEEKVKLHEKQLEEARLAIVKYKESQGVISPKKELDLELESLSKLADSQEALNVKIKGVLAKKDAITHQLSDYEKFSSAATKVSDNVLFIELKSQLAKKEIELEGLSKRFTQEHRNVKVLQAEINEIKNKLGKESPTLKSEEMLSRDPVHQNLLSELVQAKIELESLKAESNRMASTIEGKRKLIRQMPVKDSALSRLEVLANLNEETFKLMSKEHEEIGAIANRSAPGIAVVQTAVSPLYPTRPIKIYHAALAAILSLVFGIGIALISESMNTTVRYISEAEHGLGLTVLMTIPRVELGRNDVWPLFQVERKPLCERRHERVAVLLPIDIQSYDGTKHFKGETLELSMGGVSCALKEISEINVSDRVKIARLTDDEHGQGEAIEGIVVQKEYNRAAIPVITIDFLTMSHQASQGIERTIQKRKSVLSSELPAHFEEHIRGIRNELLFLDNKSLVSFLITSCVSQEGKSTIVSNLAVSLAEIARRVVVIDANLRSPCLHTIFGAANVAGLSDILSTKETLRWETIRSFLKYLPSGLSMLPAGRPVNSPSALLASKTLPCLIEILRDNFDVVLFDSPSLLVGPDSALIASATHGTIIVVKTGSTSVGDGKRAKQILERANANIIGLVMNSYVDKDAGYHMGT